MHRVLAFYLNQCKTEEGFELEDLWHLPENVIMGGEFWLSWLFPVGEHSQWNRNERFMTWGELALFKRNDYIQRRFLASFDFIIQHFGISRTNDELMISEDIYLQEYWVRKNSQDIQKIIHIIKSLYYVGHTQLANNLKWIAIYLAMTKGEVSQDILITLDNINH